MAIDGVPEDQEPIQPPIPSITSIPPARSTASTTTSPITTTIAATSTVVVTPSPTTTPPAGSNPNEKEPGAANGECRLLGPFALFVQGGLGIVALLSLVWKRYRERPRRPLKVWFFDISKQVFGSVLLHILNLLFSMFSSGNYELVAAAKGSQLPVQYKDTISAQVQNVDGHKANPCSFYLINLAIDVSQGQIFIHGQFAKRRRQPLEYRYYSCC